MIDHSGVAGDGHGSEYVMRDWKVPLAINICVICSKARLGAIESQAVGHHRNTAESHGQGGQDGMELAQHHG